MTDQQYGLGRVVQHDPKSREYPVRKVAPIQTVKHKRIGPVLDQGLVGSCTGHATAHALNHYPIKKPKERLRTNADARNLYGLATQLDGFPGTYPPDDTGSSGLAVAKAAKQFGYITRYEHAFSFEQALQALSVQPVITGIAWKSQMFEPAKRTGLVRWDGDVVGGHEFCLYGIDVERRLIHAINNWSSSWGVTGKFCMTWDDYEAALDDSGDVTVLIRD